MISSPIQAGGIFTPSRIKPTTHDRLLVEARTMVVRAADSTWIGATQIAKVVGASMVILPLTPVALVMWLAVGMHCSRELTPGDCD